MCLCACVCVNACVCVRERVRVCECLRVYCVCECVSVRMFRFCFTLCDQNNGAGHEEVVQQMRNSEQRGMHACMPQGCRSDACMPH